MASPTEMMTAVMSAATSPMMLRAALATASAIADAFSARNRWIDSTMLAPLGTEIPSRSTTGRRRSPTLARIAGRLSAKATAALTTAIRAAPMTTNATTAVTT